MSGNRKSSFHWINGDTPLSRHSRRSYYACFGLELLLNWPGRYQAYRPTADIADVRSFLAQSDLKGVSPSRLSCSAFLIDFLRDLDISYVVDIGCGRGSYSQFFRNLGKSFRYVGIDAQSRPEWSARRDERTDFIECRLGNDYPKAIPDTGKVDLVFSQSAFEHFQYDLDILRWAQRSFPNATQLHLIPATHSFFSYLAHGYRRYGGSSLKRFARVLGEGAQIYPLGNRLGRQMYIDFYKTHTGQTHPLAKYHSSADYNAIKTGAMPLDDLISGPHWQCDFFAVILKREA